MTSPFPGMDPYLEEEMWVEFQHTFVHHISQQLMPFVRPKYVALLAKRAYTEPVAVASNHKVGVDWTDLPESFIVDEVPVLNIEIRDVAERRLVTLIEILSPVNKRGQGAHEYGERRLELMQTATHLLEIDLLTHGQRLQLLGQLPPAPYYVFLSRVQRRPYTQVYAIGLRDQLPRIPVPLLPPDPDVVLDLQAALDACFDLVGYEQLLDYQAAPPASLSDSDQAWAVEQLQQAGFRQN